MERPRTLLMILAFVVPVALANAQMTDTTASTDLSAARRYVEAGRYWEASQIANRVLAMDPQNREAAEIRTEALAGLKEHQEARLREAEQLAAKSDATPEDRLALADAYFRAGRYLSAAEVYAALPESLRTREVRLRHARALSWAGRMYEAEQLYTGLLNEQEDADLRLEYGRLLSWMGSSKLAVERLRAVYNETHTEDALEALVNALAWSGNRDEAVSILQAHIERNPDSEQARNLLSDIGREPLLRLERIDRMIEVEPYNLALRMERARLLLEQERYGEARSTVEFIDEHSEQRVEGLAELRQQIETGRHAQLERLRAQQRPDLDAMTPETAEQIHELAKAYVGIQEYDEAIRLYERYLKIRPDDTKARTEYARVLSWDRRYDESQRQYEKLLAQYPDRADLRLEYARVLSYDEEYVTAIREFRDLTDLGENPRAHLYEDVPAQAHFNLGQIYRWFGWQEHAVEEQNRAIALDNGYSPARRELDLVRHLRPATNLDARYTFAEDSNNFQLQRFDIQGQKWTSPRTAIDAWVGRHMFDRSGDEVNATVLGLGGRYRFQDRLLGWARAGTNIYDEGLGTSPFWNLGGEYRPSIQSRLSAEYAHYDLVYDAFSIQSLRQDPLDIDDFRLHWDYNTGGLLSYLADASHGFISDDNDRTALHGIVAFRVFRSPYVAIKADGRYLSYDFRSDRYWSPTEYESLAGVLQVGDNYRERLFWTAELKYGKSWEETRSGERVDRDLRAIEGRVTVPINDAFDLVGAYAYGKSGRLEGILPADDDFTTYWQRRWYVGVRLKRLFRDEETRGRNLYYFEERPMNESPVIPFPPIGER